MSPIESTTPDTFVAPSVRALLGESIRSSSRFMTGASHYVFDVVTGSGRRVVVRMTRADNREALAGAIYWSERLRPIGVPLPEIIAHDIDARAVPLPTLVLERIEGTDLGDVYDELSIEEKREMASRMAEIQELAGSLPHADRYGYLWSYETSWGHRSWRDVVLASLARSRRRILDVGVVDPSVVDRVEARMREHEEYFASIPPRPFLDDTTTRNVIVHEGRLTGIVDVDELCFGDRLFTPSLTRMSLLARGRPTDYADFWFERLGIGDAQRRVVDFYMALFCVDFLGELGQRFNRDVAPPVDANEIERLEAILDRVLDVASSR